MKYSSSAKTPHAMRDDIVTLLETWATQERNSSRITSKKRVKHDHTLKAATYDNAAQYLKNMEIA